jgi:hypothetical protein
MVQKNTKAAEQRRLATEASMAKSVANDAGRIV